jgi:predicted phosphodiesterase
MPSKSTPRKPKSPRKGKSPRAPSGEIAILSDVHSNLHALRAVLEECKRRGITAFRCLGDIVGYGAYPAECLKLIRSLDCPAVLGNHDAYVSKGEIDADLNEFAQAGIVYSIAQLTAASRKWLGKRPLVLKEKAFTIVHASLHEPAAWEYIFKNADARPSMLLQTTPVCFYGHTHVPSLFASAQAHPPEQVGDSKYRFHPTGRALMNPGSVGQPRGGDPQARFAIFNPLKLTVEFVGIEYDTEGAANAIVEAGLPPYLGARLLHGV